MEELLESLKRNFDISQAHFSHIDHSETLVALVYRVDLPSKKSFILKVCTRNKDFYRELYFLNTLAEVLPVPKVEKLVQPAEGHAGAILMEYLEGTLLEESDWSHELAYEVGTNLALLHLTREDTFGDFTDCKKYGKSANGYFKGKFFEELNECVNHLPKEIIRFCQDYYRSNQYLLDRVDGPCIVHRDFRPGNIIVYKRRLVGIIDWASARFGFAEQDFCLMEHINWPRNPEFKQALLAGYSSIRKVPNYNSVMPLLRLGRAISVIGFTAVSDTWDSKNKEIYKYNRQFLNDFFLKKNSWGA